MTEIEYLAAILNELRVLHRVMCSGCYHCQPIEDPNLKKQLTKVLGVGPDEVFNQ